MQINASLRTVVYFSRLLLDPAWVPRRGTPLSEVNPLLCVPSEADLPSSAVDVSVAADCLAVRSGGRWAAAALPTGVRLAPSSCRGLRRLPGDGLHLRMRLSRPPPPPAGKAGGALVIRRQRLLWGSLKPYFFK